MNCGEIIKKMGSDHGSHTATKGVATVAGKIISGLKAMTFAILPLSYKVRWEPSQL